MDPATSIPAFYAGQSIFLTGATGFLGKVYIEKILRSCPDIREIFLLIRPKKGLSVNERLEKMLNLPLYERLRKERPSNLEKLIPVSGDTSENELGLSAADKQMLTERVTIIIHAAASVKFNDSLKYAIFTNARGTRDICTLAQSMKNLIVLVYVGTAYAHIHNPVIEEKIYPPVTDWRKVIAVAENMDEHILNIFTAKYLNDFPNTYIFSKNLAENIIREYSSSLPCAIVRPSMVMPSLKDPFPGWIDNIYGPIGVTIGGGKGILRVCYNDKNVHINGIPVDIVIRVVIAVSWKLGLTNFNPGSAPFILNCVCSENLCITYEYLNDVGSNFFDDIPFEGIIWTPNVIQTNNSVMHYVLTILLHMLPAILIDLVLKFLGHRPLLVKLQRSIYVANRALKYFAFREWQFDYANYLSLMSSILPEDQEMFSIDFISDDFIQYVRNYIIGAKKFLLHEDMNRLDAAKAHYRRCVHTGLRNSEKLGGPGRTVEIDEAKIGRRKYNRGRLIDGQWIFGGYERETKKVFVVPVSDRTEENFLSSIKEWILPGTIIIFDCWKFYNCLQNEGFQHLTINHSYNFVDSETGAHIQSIERVWREVRSKISRYGTRTIHFLGYLAEFLFKRAHDLDTQIESFFKIIGDLHPPLINIECQQSSSSN